MKLNTKTTVKIIIYTIIINILAVKPAPALVTANPFLIHDVLFSFVGNPA